MKKKYLKQALADACIQINDIHRQYVALDKMYDEVTDELEAARATASLENRAFEECAIQRQGAKQRLTAVTNQNNILVRQVKDLQLEVSRLNTAYEAVRKEALRVTDENSAMAKEIKLLKGEQNAAKADATV